jgi:hypothetical protein
VPKNSNISCFNHNHTIVTCEDQALLTLNLSYLLNLKLLIMRKNTLFIWDFAWDDKKYSWNTGCH